MKNEILKFNSVINCKFKTSGIELREFFDDFWSKFLDDSSQFFIKDTDKKDLFYNVTQDIYLSIVHTLELKYTRAFDLKMDGPKPEDFFVKDLKFTPSDYVILLASIKENYMPYGNRNLETFLQLNRAKDCVTYTYSQL